MRKIALILAMVMLLGCGFVFVSCGDDDGSPSSTSSAEDLAVEEVKYEIKASIIELNVFDGKNYTFSSFSKSSVTSTSNGYVVRGTAYVKNGSGKTLSASCTATVEYDAALDDYDIVDFDLGTFR